MPNPPTHRVTIEQFAETDETRTDGMGGTRSVSEWQPVFEDVPARYTDAASAAEGVDQQDHGEALRSQPQLSIHPRHIGDVVDGAYECAVAANGEFRANVHGLAGEDRYKVVTVVRERYGMGTVPTTITLVLELQDEADGTTT